MRDTEDARDTRCEPGVPVRRRSDETQTRTSAQHGAALRRSIARPRAGAPLPPDPDHVRRSTIALLLIPLAAASPSAADAQRQRESVRWLEYAADDEVENYLRTLQALGAVPVTPWSVRQLSPADLRRLAPPDTGHPWTVHLPADTGSGFRAALLRPRVSMRYNSAFPVGQNDGAIWAGRGVTAAVSAGAALQWGPLSLVVQPTAFWTENRAFDIRANGLTGVESFADPDYPRDVDRPQRFGDASFTRVDAGQSTLRLDYAGVTVGASTANAWWGPAQEFPFLLGTNAPGFLHVFVGTSRPLDLWIARVHGRLIYGRLEQSDYFVPTPAVARRRRFATGVVGVLTPRGMDYLELGATRFFHAPWPDDGLPARYLTRPFQGLLKESLPEMDGSVPDDSRSIDGENQLAGVFARLVLPGTGFEAYGEFGREDHSWDLRHLILSPDENSTLMLGFRQSLLRAGGRRIVTVRGELMSYGHGQADRVKGGGAIYLHGQGSNQGHTHRGQLLGANVAVGSGSAHILGLDVVDPAGRTTVEWRRAIRAQTLGLLPDGGARPRALDVMHTLGAERLLYRAGMDVSAGLDFSYNFDRDFVRDRASVGVRLSATTPSW